MGKLAFLLAIVGLAAEAGAQNFAAQPVDRFNRQLQEIRDAQLRQSSVNEPLGERILYDVGGYFSPSYLTLDDQNNNNHTLREMDLAAYASLNLDGAHEFYVRGLFTRQDFSKGDSFDGDGNRTQETLDRLYYRFDLKNALAAYDGKVINDDLVIEAGRQLIYWANGLVLNEPLDSLRVGASVGQWDLTGLVGQTPVRTVDFDSSRPEFDSHTRRLFYGVKADMQAGANLPYIYFLRQEDDNTDSASTVGPITTRFHYDSNYFGVGSTGNVADKLAYGLELVYEGGRSLSNSFSTNGGFLTQAQQRLDSIESYALDTRLDYSFADVQHSRISSEVILASGDKDRTNTSNTFGGNTPGTHDKAFNAFGLLDTGVAFNPAVSNVAIFRIGGSTFPWAGREPFEQLQLGADFFVYGKFTNGAPIDEPTKASGQFLGVEPDVFLNWQVASDITVAARYGIFSPDHRAFFSTKVRQFLYTGVTFAF